MDIARGTEMRDEYLSWEVETGARKLVEDIMLTKEGEHVVITADMANGVNTLIYTFGEYFDRTPVSRIEFSPQGSEIGGQALN